MNRTIQIASLLTALGTAACLPSLELKQPRKFTGPMVKRMQFDDTCGLQQYFDRKPPRILILGERAASLDSRTEVGQTRVLVRRGRQLTELGKVLKRFYRDVPGWLLSSDITVETDFLRRIPPPKKRGGILQQGRGVVLIPTTAVTTMASGKRMVEVVYHPCVGELLFGRETYRLRRVLLAPTPHRRARPLPRPTPRAKPRPDPRPAVRTDPRPAVRPDPRPAVRPDPRPTPRPTPRPDPRRPGLPPLPR